MFMSTSRARARTCLVYEHLHRLKFNKFSNSGDVHLHTCNKDVLFSNRNPKFAEPVDINIYSKNVVVMCDFA